MEQVRRTRRRKEIHNPFGFQEVGLQSNYPKPRPYNVVTDRHQRWVLGPKRAKVLDKDKSREIETRDSRRTFPLETYAYVSFLLSFHFDTYGGNKHIHDVL
jgi:hypothetical protein